MFRQSAEHLSVPFERLQPPTSTCKKANYEESTKEELCVLEEKINFKVQVSEEGAETVS
jgi:hypothetical protein